MFDTLNRGVVNTVLRGGVWASWLGGERTADALCTLHQCLGSYSQREQVWMYSVLQI